MMILLDCPAVSFEEASKELGAAGDIGQLLTPLTQYKYLGGQFGVDNGCYKRFERKNWLAMLRRLEVHREKCLFVAMPDVVGSARRTLESFHHWIAEPGTMGWRNRLALVAQNGIEDLDIPWGSFHALFVGGEKRGATDWKYSQAAEDVIKTAQLCGKYVHVGRVNTAVKYEKFLELEVDSIDGSGLSRYTHMRQRIAGLGHQPKLFTDERAENAV